MKARVWLGMLLVLLLGVAGLTQYALAAEKVVVFIRTGPEADGMRAVAQEFTKETGIDVEFMEIGRSGYYSTMTTQLVSGTDEFDVVATNSAYVAQTAAAGALASLDGYLANTPASYDINDLLFTYGYNDNVYGIPFDVSTHFLYYRKDLMENPPQTWDEYYEETKKWTKSLNKKSPTLFGTAFTAVAGPEPPKVFYSTMWSMGGEIFDNQGNVKIDSEGAVSAARYWRQLVDSKVIPPDISSWGFPNVLDALKTGMIAMAGPYWNAAYLQIINSDSPYKDKIGITLLPGVEQPDGSILRTPFQHGWALIMNANSKRKDTAWKFIQYATSKEGALTYTLNGGTPARRSVLEDEQLKPRAYYDLLLDSLQISKDEPQVPFYLQMHEVMNQALTEVLVGSGDPEDAMKDAAQRITELAK